MNDHQYTIINSNHHHQSPHHHDRNYEHTSIGRDVTCFFYYNELERPADLRGV